MKKGTSFLEDRRVRSLREPKSPGFTSSPLLTSCVCQSFHFLVSQFPHVKVGMVWGLNELNHIKREGVISKVSVQWTLIIIILTVVIPPLREVTPVKQSGICCTTELQSFRIIEYQPFHE